MRGERAVFLAVLVGLASFAAPGANLPRDPRDVPMAARLEFTRAKADLDGDGVPEGIVLVSALTGEKDATRGSEVILGLVDARAGGDRGPLTWARHVMQETGQPAHGGDITAVDLDGDGRSELILTWNRSLSARKVERWAEIYGGDPRAPRRIWEGWWERDTRRDPQTPAGDREWVRREVDYGATRREAGRALVLRKIHGMAAGRALEPPREAPERIDVPLRGGA
ncbi:MAG: hypothetical protein KBD01_14765 [Acidobacteria bacterium]|nr:hypothetical protein [Acidobacteriota bacterium]